ncbi:unnamed protein product [Ilex paraguariensis]|uniref:Protein kinase domain-containing protein n=1 Tax=Ilex paraguariensis TaxID=185542 RepID=A0ABC8R829_9AQUA
MAFLKCFGYRTRHKTVPERVVVAASDGDEVSNEENSWNNSCVKDVSVRRFNWEEVQNLTMNFSQGIGSGGFSTVYLANFPDSSLGAIKIHSSSERLNQVYKQELQILLRLSHNNIVNLLGYCDDREEGVLVFDHVPNGNLQEKLHDNGGEVTGRNGQNSILSWKNRMVIAFQLAQAIEYLHEKCSLHIIHGDIKASNILLDEQLNCKLCDFGSAKMGFSSTVLPPSSSRLNRMMLGSPGYTDPHYLRTGIASKKNDVYSFGVIVLELITGIEAFSTARLTSLAGPMLREATKVAEMVDPRLSGNFDLEEAKVMASISATCLHDSPSLRPSASCILRIMREKMSSIS